jgi:subtilase family serine protease
MSLRTRRVFRPTVGQLDERCLLSGGLTPAMVRQAYGENFNFLVNGHTTTADGTGQTIAIVIGGIDPNISNDLHVFDSQFGIPDPPSFSIWTYSGAQVDSHNALETSLDVEWSHAVAPRANIMLVQAKSMNTGDLMTAVDWTRHQAGVDVISMSWGATEAAGDTAYTSIFTTPAGHNGITFVASSGDGGAWPGVQWPADVPSVLSVGGTSLNTTSSGNYVSESGWTDSGGGYSRVYSAPSYQHNVRTYGDRVVPDVSYNGDPNTGVWVYDSLPQSNGQHGWYSTMGGTSAGAPQWAGLIAVADQGRSLVGLGSLDGARQTLPALYNFTLDFHDVTTGFNGYNATPGWDPVTGLGSPNAIRLVGDLSFHVGNSPMAFAAGNASTVPGTVIASSANTASSVSFGVPQSVPTPVFGSQLAAPRSNVATSQFETTFALAPTSAQPTIMTNPLANTGKARHNVNDLALEAMLKDRDLFGMI